MILQKTALFCFAALLAFAPSVSQSLGQENSQESKFQISFEGGTIGEFINLVREVANNQTSDEAISKLNIVVTENAKSVRLPEIQITTNVEGVLNLLQSLGGNGQYINAEDVSHDDTPIYVVDVQSDFVIQTEVINAKQLLDKVPETELLSAIEIGLKMSGGNSEVQLKLHEETGLLFVRGGENENMLINDIVSALKIGNGLQNEQPMGGGMMGGMGMGGMGMGGGMGMDMGGYEGGMEAESMGLGGGMGMGGLGPGRPGGRSGGVGGPANPKKARSKSK